MCISWLCPFKFKVVNLAFKTRVSLIHLHSATRQNLSLKTPRKYFIELCRTFCCFDFASHGYLASHSIIKEAFKSCVITLLTIFIFSRANCIIFQQCARHFKRWTKTIDDKVTHSIQLTANPVCLIFCSALAMPFFVLSQRHVFGLTPVEMSLGIRSPLFWVPLTRTSAWEASLLWALKGAASWNSDKCR